jgi:hypothetical protein
MDMVESADPAFLLEGESKLTRLTCPDCGGSMAQVDLPQISYFRCHVGHQFAPQALAAAQAEASEKKLWSAVAALEEQAAVLRYLQRRAAHQTGLPQSRMFRRPLHRTATRRRSPVGPLSCGARFGPGRAIRQSCTLRGTSRRSRFRARRFSRLSSSLHGFGSQLDFGHVLHQDQCASG